MYGNSHLFARSHKRSDLNLLEDFREWALIKSELAIDKELEIKCKKLADLISEIIDYIASEEKKTL